MEQKIVSKNGVRIYGYKNPALHSFCLCLYVKAGPLYENADNNGISHFFEHTAFRSINNALGGELYRRADILGITINAVTYKEFIQFKFTGSSEKFRESAEILCEIFTPFSVSKSEIDIERKRIKSELRESDEKNSLEYFSQKIIWKSTSLENTILGKNSVLDKIGQTALRNAQKELLSPDNIFFYVTGNYGDGDLEYISRLVGEKKLHGGIKKAENIAEVPLGFAKRNGAVYVKNSTEHIVRFSFDMFSERYTSAELYLLYDILFTGECSKLFKALSDESGMVYSYDASIERYNNIGTLNFLYEVSAKDVIKSVEKVVEVCRKLKDGITDELSLTKPAYIFNAGILLDEPEELGFQLGYEYKIMGKEFISLDERKKSFEDVTPERMTQIVREIFTADNLVLTFKDNKKKLDTEKIREIIKTL